MTEFKLGDRRMRLYPDGKITLRARCRGKETKQDKWTDVSFSDHNGYLRCSITVDGIERMFLQHRLCHLARNPGWDIFDTSPNNFIDHINHDTTDNSIENLRVVTCQQNQFNTNARGYSWVKQTNKWRSYINVNGKRNHLGYFDKEEDAHAAYLEAKARLHVIPVS